MSMMQSDCEVTIIEEIPVRDPHTYDGKIIGWMLVGRSGEEIRKVGAPTLSQAKEKLYKAFGVHEGEAVRVPEEDTGCL